MGLVVESGVGVGVVVVVGLLSVVHWPLHCVTLGY